MSVLLDPFAYSFMVRGFWVATLIGVTCGLLSCFVILKGWSLLGDALSHAVVPGVVVSHLMAWPLVVGAFISGMLAAVGIGGLRKLSGLKGDTSIGIMFTAFFAVGMLLISAFPSMLSLTTILFGNLLGIAPHDALQLLVISLFCIGVIALRWKDLLLFTFDEQQTIGQGLSVRGLQLLMLALIALVAVAALQAVGAILVMAMLITPGATAFLLTRRFPAMLLYAALLGGGLAFGGVYLSYFLDVSAGGVVVLLQFIVFFPILLCSPRGMGWLCSARGGVR
ncbi:metal ABC transporter permease [Carnimonas nigrificans]|uniref:metal ABC transporter permease n=1 Tax=Carnimonas nigrificans TaxID=64323 RepID=UPI000472CF71|nr:iron chelate uptake ABC transporter family permease subunit [Carnimonas nigrificans]